MSSANAKKDEGNAHFSAKRYAEAVNAFTEALAIDPAFHIAYSNRSAAYAALGKYDEALADADKTLDLQPSFSKAYQRKAAALCGLNRLDDAHDAISKALDAEPTNKAYIAERERIEALIDEQMNVDSGFMGGAGGPGGAGGDFMAQLFDPNLFKGVNVVAELAANPQSAELLQDAKFVEILNEIQANPEANLRKHTQDKRLLQVLLVLMMSKQKRANPAAFEDLEKRRLAEAEERARQQAKREDEERERRAAEKKKKEAEEAAAKLAALTPEQKQAIDEKELGNAAYKKKEFATALAHYTRALEIDPTNAVPMLNRAAVYFEQNDMSKCIQECEAGLDKCMELMADFQTKAKFYLRLGKALMKLERFEEARLNFDKSLTEHRTPDALACRQAADKAAREKAARDYESPEKAAEAKARGDELFKKGDFPDAIKEYDEGLKRAPRDTKIMSNRAGALMKLGEYVEAAKQCERALEIEPTFVKVIWRLGECHRLRKEYHKAIAMFERGLKLEPQNPQLMEGLERTVTAIQAQSSGAESAEETEKRAMADPEIRKILTDPAMQMILQDLQTNPEAARVHLKDARVRENIDKLVAAGIIRTK